MGIRNAEGYMDIVPYQAIANIEREMKAEAKNGFRPLVYIYAPFSGDIEANKRMERQNKKNVQKIGR